MDDEFDLGGTDSPLQRQVKPMETLVLRERVSYVEAVAASQEYKTQLFSGGLRKPRFEDVSYVRWAKVYDAFWYMEGSYVCDFLRRQTYSIPVAPDVVSLKVGENVYPVERAPGSAGLVSLDVVEKCDITNIRSTCVNATTGVEDPAPIVLLDGARTPIASISEHISAGREGRGDVVVQPLALAARDAVARFEGTLLARPKDAQRILVERMTVGQSLVYVARFAVRFRNQRDGAERELSVHGVTGAVTW